MFTNPPIRMGDALWFYYGSTRGRHPGGKLKRYRGSHDGTALGRAVLRVDGFVSLDTGSRTGRARTVPYRLAHNALCVNADAGGGEVRAQLTRRGRPLAGFDFGSCEPLCRDRTRHIVRFKGGAIPRTREPLRVEFALKQASLYAFWAEPLPPMNL